MSDEELGSAHRPPLRRRGDVPWPIAVAVAVVVGLGAVLATRTVLLRTAPRTRPLVVHEIYLHGYVTWPVEPLAGIQPNGQPGFPKYDLATAKLECANEAKGDTLSQILVRGPAGDYLAVADINHSDIRPGQASGEIGTANYVCAVGWATAPLPKKPTYQVVYEGHSVVINAADAGNTITLS